MATGCDVADVSIVVHTTVPVKPDERAAALELVEELLAQSRTEDGTVTYRASTGVLDPNAVRFFERYEDEAALAAHQESDAYARFQDVLPDLLDGELETLTVDADGTVEVVRWNGEEVTRVEP
jgi:quinol monooxygenase YgiN